MNITVTTKIQSVFSAFKKTVIHLKKFRIVTDCLQSFIFFSKFNPINEDPPRSVLTKVEMRLGELITLMLSTTAESWTFFAFSCPGSETKDIIIQSLKDLAVSIDQIVPNSSKLFDIPSNIWDSAEYTDMKDIKKLILALPPEDMASFESQKESTLTKIQQSIAGCHYRLTSDLSPLYQYGDMILREKLIIPQERILEYENTSFLSGYYGSSSNKVMIRFHSDAHRSQSALEYFINDVLTLSSLKVRGVAEFIGFTNLPPYCCVFKYTEGRALREVLSSGDPIDAQDEDTILKNLTYVVYKLHSNSYNIGKLSLDTIFVNDTWDLVVYLGPDAHRVTTDEIDVEGVAEILSNGDENKKQLYQQRMKEFLCSKDIQSDFIDGQIEPVPDIEALKSDDILFLLSDPTKDSLELLNDILKARPDLSPELIPILISTAEALETDLLSVIISILRNCCLIKENALIAFESNIVTFLLSTIHEESLQVPSLFLLLTIVFYNPLCLKNHELLVLAEYPESDLALLCLLLGSTFQPASVPLLIQRLQNPSNPLYKHFLYATYFTVGLNSRAVSENHLNEIARILFEYLTRDKPSGLCYVLVILQKIINRRSVFQQITDKNILRIAKWAYKGKKRVSKHSILLLYVILTKSHSNSPQIAQSLYLLIHKLQKEPDNLILSNLVFHLLDSQEMSRWFVLTQFRQLLASKPSQEFKPHILKMLLVSLVNYSKARGVFYDPNVEEFFIEMNQHENKEISSCSIKIFRSRSPQSSMLESSISPSYNYQSSDSN